MTSTMKPAKRILCVLLAFLLVFTACFMPMAKAAVVETIIAKYGVEILATILIGSGIGFASSDNARSAAAGCWDWMSTHATDAWNTIQAWSIKALENPGIVSNSGVRMTASLWNAIEGAVSSFRLADGTFIALQSSKIGDLPDNATYYIDQPMYKQLYYKDAAWAIDVVANDTHKYEQYYLMMGTSTQSSGNFTAWDKRISDVGFCGLTASPNSSASNGVYTISVVFSAKFQKADGTIYTNVFTSSYGGGLPDDIVKFGLGDAVAIPSTGDLVYPSDNYLVRMPDIPDVQLDADGKETIVYPDMALDQAAHLADIPKADVATGELVDVPTDVLVDVGTGELVQTGEGTGEGTDTGLWDWLKSLLKSILDAIKSILAAIVGFFDTPADFRLDFDGFKNMRLPTRFPFCIPFDFVNAIRVFARNAQDFQFRIDLETSYFQIHHVVDLTPFILPIAFFRYTACIWFGLVLINKTRDLIKW